MYVKGGYTCTYVLSGNSIQVIIVNANSEAQVLLHVTLLALSEMWFLSGIWLQQAQMDISKIAVLRSTISIFFANFQ